MTANSNYQQPVSSYKASHCSNSRNSRIALGALIVLIGALILSKQLWLFTLPFHIWPLTLIAIGVYSGVKHQFRNFGSWVLISLGVLFALPKFWVLGVVSTHLAAPVILVLLGIYLIVTPRGRKRKGRLLIASTMEDDTLNLDVTFGEKTTVITSKAFKGGAINNSFGESKINLLQADNAGPIILDLRVSFGSVELIVPSHWDVEFNINNSFASVEDKRYMRTAPEETRKVLTLIGSCSFGSVTVKSM